MEGLTAPDRFFESQLSVDLNSRFELNDLARRLIRLGYERTAAVEGPGQFSIRGGIVDIAPIDLEHPVRLEFFGDEIDSLRSFSSETQRSLKNITEAVIGAARETLYEFEALEQIKEDIWEAAQAQSERLHRLMRPEEGGDQLLAVVARHLEAFDERGGYFPGIDQYKPFFGRAKTLFDLPEDVLWFG